MSILYKLKIFSDIDIYWNNLYNEGAFEVINVSKCYLEDYTIPSASFGETNPLPDIKNVSYIHAKINVTDNVDREQRDKINTGMIDTMLPYRQQDLYDRNLKNRVFKAIILENKYLKAVFMPELGGRLWSLFDKENGKELLYRNPVFQPANLALRNAWFSGGVEFNVSIKGHNPLTCSSMFARKICASNGTEGARFYEYERIRGVAYGFDAWLDNKMLYIRPRIENRSGKEVWMYWWSNIAVPETKKTRVIVPADEAYINYFQNDSYELDMDKIPELYDTDVSYPLNLKHSRDFFYKIPDDEEKWITAVDEGGYGLLQCSTHKLKGRKLFVWGNGNAGRNWNNYLSDGKNSGYIEIQAGLAYTQLEHIPMSDGDIWSWVEAYGAVDVPKSEAHGEWNTAKNTISNYIGKLFPLGVGKTLDDKENVEFENGEMLHIGSGWGALENLRRAQSREISLSDTFEFPKDSLTNKQNPWITLLKDGVIAEMSPDVAPDSYLVDAEWLKLMEKASRSKFNQNWYFYMQYGVMCYANGDLEKAKSAFIKSIELNENCWSLRNLAMIYKNELGDIKTAYEFMVRAISLNKKCRALAVDTAVTFLAAEKAEEWLETYDSLDDTLKCDGRLRFYCAKAYIALKQYKEATKILNEDFVMPDIKEGDTAITDVWQELYRNIISIETGETDIEKLNLLVNEQFPLGNLDFKIH